MTLREKLETNGDFLLGVELVSTRGTVTETRAARSVAFAEELAAHDRVDWVSFTDNAGGNPQLAPAALARIVRASGRDVVVHLSCKDFNRNALESEVWHLASEGLHNLLVLSGDYPGPGLAGGAKPVFDIDSVGLLVLLANLNAGLDVTRPGARQSARLAATEFFPACVVTNFKLHENEVVPQLLKLEKKLQCGARWIINQIGYDSRKIHELILWLRHRGWGHVPLIGNVYVLNPAVARLFREKRIPGVVISDELAALCEAKAREPDRGRSWFLELAARQVAIYRGLGYRGAYLGGIHSKADLDAVLASADRFAPDAWQGFAKEIRFSRPGEFFLNAEDPATGLADPNRPNAAPPARRPSRNVTYSYRFAKAVHAAMFTPGKGLWNLGRKVTSSARAPMQGPTLLRVAEKIGKSAMFDCRDCGDCSLPEIAFLCPESACAKNQRNGPCGGTRDGLCEVEDYECIWSRAYDRLSHEGRAEQLLDHAPVIQDQSLRDTSSWANTWQGRDHLARKLSVPSPAAPVPVTGRGETGAALPCPPSAPVPPETSPPS
ncbi:MAG: methylenetetrahydrofolate reductase C-terminal domain-containing protein [Opitutaceae bacterium]|nr:methylenetetrahydrofolate reductase C-terminal domain-containing protein [Opitutaceae bacterium]